MIGQPVSVSYCPRFKPPLTGDVFVGAVQERHNLRPGAGVIGTKGSGGGPGSDALCHGPQHSVIVVSAGPHIHKGVASGVMSWGSGRPPQEGENLRTGAYGVETEGESGGSASDSFRRGPLHRVVVIGAAEKFAIPQRRKWSQHQGQSAGHAV